MLQVVWFKRDLRLVDHRPLAEAAGAGPVLPLFLGEPGYWALSDTSWRQWAFLDGAAQELAREIERRGGRLVTRTGDAVAILQSIRDAHGPFALHAHQETGNFWTYQRDEAVRAWCRRTGTPFTETMQFGVWRGSSFRRDGWAKRWDAMMAEPITPEPVRINWFRDAECDPWPDAEALGLAHDGIEMLQPPGRTAALSTLHSFLHERGEPYQKAMSTPLAGATACSRLSVHFVAGSVSMREVAQATLARQAEVRSLPAGTRGDWPKALRSFVGRLHWHCHFMQKLETEPELEFRPMARAYEGLRPIPNDETRIRAYEEGRTGYPFVDACLRSLKASGWINFRMRAMLMSFASYHLWLPWRMSGDVLGRWFTDYEAGIHWTQSQMQSGETGINSVRIYSPVKQGYDQDPDGVFVRRWVPELAHIEDPKVIQEPWKKDAVPDGYPEPIVDHVAAVKEAKTRIYAVRRQPEARAEAEAVFQRHGSRKRPENREWGARRAKARAADKAKEEAAAAS